MRCLCTSKCACRLLKEKVDQSTLQLLCFLYPDLTDITDTYETTLVSRRPSLVKFWSIMAVKPRELTHYYKHVAFKEAYYRQSCKNITFNQTLICQRFCTSNAWASQLRVLHAVQNWPFYASLWSSIRPHQTRLQFPVHHPLLSEGAARFMYDCSQKCIITESCAFVGHTKTKKWLVAVQIKLVS